MASPSEKTRYVLGEDSDQVSLFNEAEQESNSAPEPKPGTLVAGHTRKSKGQKKSLQLNYL